MTDFRKVTQDLSVAPQIAVSDIPVAAERGFALVINNRPDGEAPDREQCGGKDGTVARQAGEDAQHVSPVLRPGQLAVHVDEKVQEEHAALHHGSGREGQQDHAGQQQPQETAGVDQCAQVPADAPVPAAGRRQPLLR